MRVRIGHTTCVVSGVVLIIVTLLGWVAWSVATLYIRPSPVSRDFLWQVSGHLYAVASNLPPVAFTLVSKDGEPLKGNVPWGFGDGVLAYWSGTDRSLAVLRDGRDIQWFKPPAGVLRDTWDVGAAWVAGSRYVLLNLLDERNEPAAVIIVDTSTGKWRRARFAVAAYPHGNSTSDEIALLEPSGVVMLSSASDPSLREELGRIGTDASVPWTVDCERRTLFWIDGGRIWASHRSDRPKVIARVPQRYSSSSYIAWHPSVGELWLSVNAPFCVSGILVYSNRGVMYGSLEHYMGPAAYPQPMDEEIRAFLDRSQLPRTALTRERVIALGLAWPGEVTQ